MMNKNESGDVIISVPLVDQLKDTNDEKWKHSTCGICVLKMLMSFKDPGLLKMSVMDLVNEGLAIDGYLENVGWKHFALVDIAKKYGVELQYQKLFFYGEEKKKGIKIIDKNLKSGLPVAVSVHLHFDKNKGGHLAVVNGLRVNGRKVEGYFIQDPYPNGGDNNYFVTKEEFINGWRGGMIWFR